MNKEKTTRNERVEYVTNIADNVLTAVENVFGETVPSPTGSDMIEAIAFASVFVFAKQISMSCKSKKTMQSVMKSVIRSLQDSLNILAEPLMEGSAAWDEFMEEE